MPEELGGANRRVVAPVIVLQSEHEVGVVDVVLDADGEAHLPKRLLEIVAAHAVGKDRQRRSWTHGGRGWLPLALASLLPGDVLVDVEAATALASPPASAGAPWNGAGSKGDGRVAAALVSTRLTMAPASSRVRSCGGRTLPRSASSTVSASGACTTTRSRSWISMSTSKVGGDLRRARISGFRDAAPLRPTG